MVGAIVSFAVQQLGEFAIQKVVFLQGVREDVEWLRDELRYMQSFIKDAEQKGGGDQRVRQWVNDIKCVADEAVDIIDSFSVEIQKVGAPKGRFMDRVRTCACIRNKEAKLYDIGKEIGLLKKRVLEITRRRELYGITNLGSSAEGTSSSPLRRATPYTDERVVGFEDVTQTLLAELLKEDPCRRVVSVYGMGGLGKTTLARKLYNSTSAVHHFPYRAWVCVSQAYRTQDLLQSIIKSFKGGCNREELEMLDRMNEADLEQYLHEFLIIITTRNKEIAIRTAEGSFSHELRFLTQGESWDLFCQKAFPGDGEISCRPPAMTMLAREMVEKCGGLPLAIVALGGLLSYKTGPEEWAKLKLCFLYLGMFPEDCEIETARLTRLWMAEEFIIPSEQRMEDVAEDYINQLINRSLIQVAGRCWEKVVTCRVHDLLRDLAVRKARKSPGNPLPPLQPLSSSTRLLYLTLEGAIDELPASSSFPESLASLILRNSEFKEDPMPMLESLPNLRSLELISAYKGNKIVCSASGFRQLEVIRISDMGELEEWQVEEGAMPVIKGWYIHKCDKLKIIPERLKSVPMVGESTYTDNLFFNFI
ncbi:hypothetical protein RJ639_037829 [Escallonia herrerae]|uniref:Disease resistance protein n=1 Tax=Escallonia herrerae TaxID=1293975 RepID=A0AA89B417_9ASTE|nr:hypothetical protein RJ639_037829 [Escallonia herrerae]